MSSGPGGWQSDPLGPYCGQMILLHLVGEVHTQKQTMRQEV